MTPTPHRVRPVGARVLIRPNSRPQETTTEVGIVLPESVAQPSVWSGEVLAAGDFGEEYDTRPMGSYPCVGDVVLFDRHAGSDVAAPEGEALRLIPLRDILAIVAPAAVADVEPVSEGEVRRSLGLDLGPDNDPEEFEALLRNALDRPGSSPLPNVENVLDVLEDVWGPLKTVNLALRDADPQTWVSVLGHALEGRLAAQGLDDVNTANDHLIGSTGDRFGPTIAAGDMDRDEALRFAAWLSLLADPLGLDFARVRAACART